MYGFIPSCGFYFFKISFLAGFVLILVTGDEWHGHWMMDEWAYSVMSGMSLQA